MLQSFSFELFEMKGLSQIPERSSLFFVFIPLLTGRIERFFPFGHLFLSRRNRFFSLIQTFSSLEMAAFKPIGHLVVFFSFLYCSLSGEGKNFSCGLTHLFFLVLSWYFCLSGRILFWLGIWSSSTRHASISIGYSIRPLDVRYSGNIYAVQLYATILLYFIFIFGWRLWQQKLWQRWYFGKIFAAMIFLLGISTSFLEFFEETVSL